MIKQFFFGSSDSPLFMFHHALGALLIIIFSFLFIAAILGWLSSRRKKKVPQPVKKIIIENKTTSTSHPIIEEEKISVTHVASVLAAETSPEISTPIARDSEDTTPYISAKNIPEPPKEIVTEDVEVYSESICNTREQLLHFTEILLNKKLTEQDWDKRIPETILLDHRSYHQLIFQLLYLNTDTTETTSRFKLVLETSSEVAINHQVYFRNWMAPLELIAAFKSENNSTVTPDEKRIRIAVKIAEKKNWKLQASSSEQGTMINLLMKLRIN